MILVYNLKDNFTSNAILLVDSSVSINKEIQIGDFYVFCDNNFKVNSINIINADKYNIPNKKTFFVLSPTIWNNIKKTLLMKNEKLSFSNLIMFQYGKIIKREAHPKSKKLFLVTLLINKKDSETTTLVTNTLDSTVNKVVVFANKGSSTASGTPVLANEIMGVKSVGMLVGYETLGLSGESLIFGSEESIGKKFNF